MKTCKLSLWIVLAGAGLVACGSNTSNNNPDAGGGGIIVNETGGASGTGGTGGALPSSYDSGLDAVTTPADAPMETSPTTQTEVGTSPMDMGEGGSSSSLVNCTGLTPAQCNDLIINPATLDPAIVTVPPGPDPSVLYPACSAI
ncbi:MAG: hypothetical protein ABSB49_10535 [Polyangia bacterium]|jgi:hypothetical protein